MTNLNDALRFLPVNSAKLFNELAENVKNSITELRIRREKPMVIMIGNTPYFITEGAKLVNHFTDKCVAITSDDFDEMFGRICSYSVQSHIDTMINGYITERNGNRIGIASSAVIKNGQISAVKDISSVNIRIARDVINCARGVLNTLYVGSFPSIIVAAPPGGGKTTFLRDFSRLLSSGFGGKYRKVAIVDERDEIAAFDVGLNTDILTSYPKKNGIEIAVRTLSPDIIICDEIADEDEVEKIKFGFSSGVAFAVSVHIKNIDDIFTKSVMQKLILTGEFDYVVLLEKYGSEFTVMNLRSLKNEDDRFDDDFGFFSIDGDFPEP